MKSQRLCKHAGEESLYEMFLIGCLLFLLQLTVYLGKRDFVDHVDLVEPVGEINFNLFSLLLCHSAVCSCCWCLVVWVWGVVGLGKRNHWKHLIVLLQTVSSSSTRSTWRRGKVNKQNHLLVYYSHKTTHHDPFKRLTWLKARFPVLVVRALAYLRLYMEETDSLA